MRHTFRSGLERSLCLLVTGFIFTLLCAPCFSVHAQSPAPIVLPFQVGESAGEPAIGTIRNLPLASLEVCEPGPGGNCQTIDSILIDTSSAGLRIRAQALSVLQLQPEQLGGTPIAECVGFEFGFMWGPVVSALIQFPPADQNPTTAAGPIQVIDQSFGTANPPTGCDSNSGVELLGSSNINGVLGIGPFADTSQLFGATYFTCENGSCQTASIPASQAVANPVGYIVGPGCCDNSNGIFIVMGPVPPGGVSNASGKVIFGVGTLPGNDPGSIAPGHPFVTINSDSCHFFANYKDQSGLRSCLDSATGMLHFDDQSLTRCSLPGQGVSVPQAYCPPSPSMLSATIFAGASSQPIAFEVADDTSSFSAGNIAFPDLAMSFRLSDADFVWGLPFFYNRAIFIAYQQTPLGNAPAWGYAYLSPYDSIDVTIETGTDDAGSGTQITGTFTVNGSTPYDACLKPTTANQSWVDSTCNNSNNSAAPNSWPNWNLSDQTFSTSLAEILAQNNGTLDIKLLQSSCGLFCDNWDLQRITVTLKDSTSPNSAKTILDVAQPDHQGDNCIARLKGGGGQTGATIVRFSLDGSNTSIYLDGEPGIAGQPTNCKNNGG
jgi:hypothetical protein